jgi:outer membrane protein TolC
MQTLPLRFFLPAHYNLFVMAQSQLVVPNRRSLIDEPRSTDFRTLSRTKGDEMRFSQPSSWRFTVLFAILIALSAITPMALADPLPADPLPADPRPAGPLPLDLAIRLALSHSTTTAISQADVQHAIAAYRELRNNRIPQLIVGSGLGWSYGFPLSIEGTAPALANVTSQSSVINLAQNQLLRGARAEIKAATFQDKDQRNAVIEDVAVSYAALAKWEARLNRLQQDESEARQMEEAVSKRVREGVDSSVDLNKAKLVAARVRLHRTEASGSADVLRRHLAGLTGLPVSAIEPDPASIPALPPVHSDEDSQEKALTTSPTIKFADQHALAESMRAVADHRGWLPTVDFSAQYARLSNQINNYGTYYVHFQPNNATIGVGVRFPIFNASQRALAQATDLEALKAKKQAEATRDRVSEETLKLQRAAEELEAARDVAQLEYELAQSGLEAAQTRIKAETGTLHQLSDAQVQASEHYLLFQDAEFEYQRARLNLLRATGDLERWALPSPAAK